MHGIKFDEIAIDYKLYPVTCKILISPIKDAKYNNMYIAASSYII